MEIGSENYTDSAKRGKNDYYNLVDCPKRYVLSGRTGLGLISQELKARAKSVFMPNYCCGSMIYPFVNEGFNIFFYDAFDLSNVIIDERVDAVLLMDYFGFLSSTTASFAKRCKEMGKIVIVDATQTAFSASSTYEVADYIVVSYRKWFDCLCGVVYSKDDFVTKEYEQENEAYYSLWRTAALLKRQFIKKGLGEKSKFLSLYSQANSLLDGEYRNFKANAQEVSYLASVDSNEIRRQRRTNASFLIEKINKLSKIYNVELLYSKIQLEDCPLFVPILVDEIKKDTIRKSLSNANIYCPAHWPIDRRYSFEETDYHKREISLICDQRYSAEDMELQIAVLIDALKNSSK